MINTTPISSYNMQNAYQLGQIMQEQDAYTPSINPLSSSLSVPVGYSLNQWQQELSLAREQYFARPLMAAGNLLSTSFGTALLFKEMSSGVNSASAAFAQGVGRTIGEGVGWGVGQGIRGGLRFGEASANYITGGAFTKANDWIAGKTGFKFQRLSSVIDKGATKLNGWINALNAQSDLLSNTALRNETFSAMSAVARSNRTFAARAVELNSQLKAAKAAKDALEVEKVTAAIAENQAAIIRGQKAVKAIYNSGLAKAAPKGLKAFKDISAITTRVGGAALGFVGTFFSPAFLLKQALIDRAIDFGVESYENYNTRMDMHREILAKGGRILRFGDATFSQGIEGGFSEAQRQHLVNYLDRMAARDYTVQRNDWFGMGSWSPFGGHKRYSENLKELKALLSVSADMGMLDMSKSLDEVEKRFDSIVKAVKKMSRITGKSKGELAMALASTQQTEARFNINDAAASLQRKIYAATASGASLQTILQESAMGAQMGVQAGIGKAAGADLMISSRNIYSRMYRRRMLDRGDIDMMGGEQGVVSSLAAGMMSMTNNNVFKAQLAMFFDPNTGRMDRRRMQEYMNGDMKNTMREATERNIAMNTMSYNPFTGREEMGGRLNARMAFVERALQHGDIKTPELIGFARQMMKENEAVWGRANAQRMMMGFFTQTMGLDRASLIMKAMNDESLMKPDLKEQLAVSRKQLEDRYTAEYNKAASGFGSELVRGLINAAGMSIDTLSRVVTLGFSGSNIRKKWNSAYLGWGNNAMSPKMLNIGSLGTDWLPWVGESDLEVYNRYNTLRADIISNDENVSFNNVEFKEKYDNGAIFNKEWFKELLSNEEYRTLSEKQKRSFVQSKKDDTLGSFLAGETDEFNFENHMGSDWLSERISKGMLGTSGNLSRSDMMTLRRHVEFARERLLADNPLLSEDEILEQISDRYRKASYIASRNENWLKDVKYLTNRTSTAEYLGATIRYSGNVLRSRTYAASGYEAQLDLQDSLKNYMSKVKKQGLESGSKEDRQIYARFFMTEEDYRNYLAKKIYNKEVDNLTDEEKSSIYERAAVVRLKGTNIFRKRSEFTQAIPNAPDRALETSEYIKVGENMVKWLETEEKAVTEAELNKLASWVRFNKKDNRSTKDIFKDLKDTDNGKYKLSDRNNLFGEMYASESSPASTESDEDTKEDVGITGDSKLNQEILKTLKSLNSTLTNLNTGMGYGARQVSDWF